MSTTDSAATPASAGDPAGAPGAAATTVEIGTVQTLRRYPVKSMLGEEVPTAVVTGSGLDHDRVFALIDEETGRVGSAKQPRLWRTLLQCTARWNGEAVGIELPGGRTLTTADPDVEAALSKVIGRPVRLSDTRPEGATIARPDPEDVIEQGEDAEVSYRLLTIGRAEPGGTFVDYAPVSLVTTSTLDRAGFEPLRYRPNVVIRTPSAIPAFVENDWIGREIRIGAVRLRGLIPIERCAIPTLEHGALPRAVDAVRRLLTLNRIALPDGGVGPCLGVYAEVLQPGTIRAGDTVTLT